ncbi:MAG: NAD(P)/FAD-dependent oxidoreductase [Verrucomicrobiales bacterium]|nr:NAD(P)/FAD-dependent oxidoreductase [Verrucomicrobiales bacterium]
MQKEWDLIVIGGGAAGFFTAITAASELDRPARILILEKSSHFLGKVKISGGGRCNVTHACFDSKEFSRAYPRGERALLGPLHHWGATDTVDWFESRGIQLKTEADGRMFPVSDDSQSIIDCLIGEARKADIQMQCSCGVVQIHLLQDDDSQTESPRFQVNCDTGENLTSHSLLIATGGTRNAIGEKLAQSLGHHCEPAVPSLFTFKINDPLIEGLQGLSVNHAKLSCQEIPKLSSHGPLLITHWGLSGPASLRLSAWGARQLADKDYQFTLRVNWLGDSKSTQNQLDQARQQGGKRRVSGASVIAEIPKRLWKRLCHAAGVTEGVTWSQLPKSTERKLLDQLHDSQFQVTGKSMNKDEFVTCGGIVLKEINLRYMESRLCPKLYFAGEILNIDGITGGFNFQNAWTTGHLAGQAIAEKILS